MDYDDSSDCGLGENWSLATWAIFIIACWSVVNIGFGFVGLVDAVHDTPRYPVRRFEVVLPGYRVGRWLGSPVQQ